MAKFRSGQKVVFNGEVFIVKEYDGDNSVVIHRPNSSAMITAPESELVEKMTEAGIGSVTSKRLNG